MNKYLTAALSVFFLTSAHAAIIDGFDEGSTVITLNAPGAKTVSQFGLLNVLGGVRQVELRYLQPLTGGVSSEVRIDDPGMTNSLTLSNGSRVASTLYLRWFPTQIGGFDATNAGTDFAFVVGLLAVDLNVTFKMTVQSMNGGVSTLTKSNIGVGDVIFKYSNFAGNANFQNLGFIQLQIDGPRSYDLEIDDIGTSPVPEPATCAMLGGALLSLGILRRIRR